MNAFIFIIVISEIRAYYVPKSDSPNVGTVLFKTSDLEKKQWSKSNIALLQARKYFQNLIPSPHLIETMNEDYLTYLLTYFEDSYTTIKREIKNPSLREMMEVALSDALGGYLKIWVLPITKYAYYGGTVPLEKAVRTFEMYENIKRSLKTSGRGWHSPNENLLKSVAVNVVSLRRDSLTRKMTDPCKSLAYYEQTKTGMTIPLPFISWGISPTTMFVPLKNQSLILLSSPDSSKILLKYYNIAENCMHAQNPRLNEFDQRFQKWLSTDVAPHLSDDKLYIAFGGVLSLMNMTKRFCEKISNVCNNQFVNLKYKACSIRKPMQFYSKKFLIIAVILFIEILWCIPTLILIISARKRKRKNRKYLSRLFRRKSNDSMEDFYPSDQNANIKNTIPNDVVEKSDKTEGSRGVKLFWKPKTRNLEVNVQFPSCDSKYVTYKKTSKTLQKKDLTSEQITVVNELPIKSSLKKNLPEFDITANCGELTSDIKQRKGPDNTKSKHMVKETGNIYQDLEASKTMTLIKDSEHTIQEITYSLVPSLISHKDLHSSCRCCTPGLKIDQSNNNVKNNTNGNTCPCTTCLKGDQIEQRNKIKKVTYNEVKPKRGSLKKNENKGPYRTVMRSRIEPEKKPKRTNFETNKARVNKKNAEMTSNKLLRIRIERPEAAIKVGISSYKEQSRTPRKPSKIPRLTVNMCKEQNKTENETTGPSTDVNSLRINNAIIRTKGLVIKGKALDDSAIKNNPIMDKKLNVTL